MEDARWVAEALSLLLPVLEFRDRDRVSAHGVSPSQWYALRAVTVGGGLTVNQLAGAIYLDKSTASRIAAGLADRELLAREASPDDARTVRLVATASGRALCAAIQADEERDTATLLSDLEPAVRTEVRRAVILLAEIAAAGVETAGGNCWVVR